MVTKGDAFGNGLPILPGEGVDHGNVVAVPNDRIGSEGITVYCDRGIYRIADTVYKLRLGAAVEGGQ